MNLMECPEFRRLLRLLRKDLRESDIPHWTKLRELIVETWYEYFDALKQDMAVSVRLFYLTKYLMFFQKAEGKISFTSDLWSDENRHPFMALMAHWITQQASKLVLKAGLIAFTHIPGSHDGVSLAAIILGLLDHAEVMDKVSD